MPASLVLVVSAELVLVQTEELGMLKVSATEERVLKQDPDRCWYSYLRDLMG
jgi:hypothetical protein